MDLSHFRLHGETLRYRFPTGTKLAPGARAVVSPNPPALKAAYADHGGVGESDPLGPYVGSLANGGDKIVLLDGNGREVDRIAYDDEWPWDHAADALGGGDRWLEEGTPYKVSLALLLLLFFSHLHLIRLLTRRRDLGPSR